MADIAGSTYSVDYSKIKELADKFNTQGQEIENIINSYLHGYAPDRIRPSIEGLVPRSNRQKKHAADSKPFGRQENYNLAVKIMTSKKFNYLVFPDEAQGTSKVNMPQNFTGRGLEAVVPDLVDEMVEYIDNLIGW